MTITKRFVAPALPVPTVEYDQRQQTDVLRALRLYFNLTDDYIANTLLDALNGGLGGNTITFPHICASDSTDQYAAGNDTPTVVSWNTLDSGFGWDLNAPGSATAQVAGVYKITYSLQIINTANAIHYATVWLRVNTNNITNSATKFLIPARKSATPGEEGFICAYSEITFSVNVGDEIELVWATDVAYNTVGPVNGVYLLHEPAQTTPYAHPAIPSAVGSIIYVSALP